MYKKYVYKRLFAATLAVSLLAGAMGVQAMQNQNIEDVTESVEPAPKKQPWYERFGKWLFVGNPETLEKIYALKKEINKRETRCKKETKEVRLDPNQSLRLNTKKLKKKVQSLRRREASAIYKFFTTSPEKHFAATVEKSDLWSRSLVAVKNAIPSVTLWIFGKFLGKFVEPLFKPKLIPETKEVSRWSKHSKAVSVSKWIAYGLAIVYAARTVSTTFVEVKENLELDELEQKNGEQKQIKIKEVKLNGDNAPTYVEKQQDV